MKNGAKEYRSKIKKYERINTILFDTLYLRRF